MWASALQEESKYVTYCSEKQNKQDNEVLCSVTDVASAGPCKTSIPLWSGDAGKMSASGYPIPIPRPSSPPCFFVFVCGHAGSKQEHPLSFYCFSCLMVLLSHGGAGWICALCTLFLGFKRIVKLEQHLVWQWNRNEHSLQRLRMAQGLR